MTERSSAETESVTVKISTAFYFFRSEKMGKATGILLTLVVVLGILAAYFYFYQYQPQQRQRPGETPGWTPPEGPREGYLVIDFTVYVGHGDRTHPVPVLSSPKWNVYTSNTEVEKTLPNQWSVKKDAYDGIIMLNYYVDGDLAYSQNSEGIHAEWENWIEVARSIKIGYDGQMHEVRLTVDQWVQEPLGGRYVNIFDEDTQTTFKAPS